jgi:4-alpha-glucanotransferase
MKDPRDELARRLGILPRYRDATGTDHELTPETRDALLAAMGVGRDGAAARDRLAALEEEGPLPTWQVVTAGAGLGLDALAGRDWTLALEDGSERTGEGGELGPLPLGIHEIRVEGTRHWLLSAPERLPEPARAWGVTLPLYGLSRDGRIGTYADLAEAAASIGAAGADFVGLNPTHAGFPTDPSAFSPYAPAHRGRLAAIHVAPAEEAAIPAGDLLDYAAALPARMAALRAEFAQGAPAAFATWRAEQGADLDRFALHQALSDRFGCYWPDWPREYRDPEGEAAREFARHADEACAFHAWLQWRAEGQLEAAQEAARGAGMRFGLYLDLAVGTHPAGAETWGRPALFARGVSLGAPPDAFSASGQSWGLAPLRPDTLAAEGFRPLAAILRRALGHSKLLRIDHILGFERAFWVPTGEEAPPGAYVGMPREALLAVVRIEAARAGATVIGEDLGNIPDGLRDGLEDSGVLGCRVAQFERHWESQGIDFKRAGEYARSALTSFGTHDLPTWEGWKAGRDIDWRRSLGDLDDAGHEAALAERQAIVAAFCGLIGGAGLDDLHRFLAATPSRLVACQIEDLLGRAEQPNLPGTVHDHPNWRRRLKVAPDALGQLDAMARTATIMAEADR